MKYSKEILNKRDEAIKKLHLEHKNDMKSADFLEFMCSKPLMVGKYRFDLTHSTVRRAIWDCERYERKSDMQLNIIFEAE